MKCSKCGHMWSPKNDAASVDCPQCGSFSKPENIEEALWALCKTIGAENMENEKLLLSAFADLAPELKKERNFLKLFIEAHGPKKIAAVKTADDKQQDNACKAVARDLSENWGMAPETADAVCKAYLHAITDKVPTVKNPEQPKDLPALSDPPRKQKTTVSPELPKGERKPPQTPPTQTTVSEQAASLSSGGCLLSFLVWIVAFVGMLFFFNSGNWGTPLINTIILMIPVTLVILFFIGKSTEKTQQKYNQK